VDPRFRVVFGPVTIPSQRRGAPPVITIERVKVRPRWRALLAGRAEAAIVSLDGVTVETGRRGEALRDLAERLDRPKSGAAPAASGGTDPPLLRVSGLRVRGPALGKLALEVGPISGDARVSRGGDVRTLEFRLRLPGRATADGELWRESGALSAAVRVQHLTPEILPEALRRRLPAEIVSGALSGEVDAAGLGGPGGTVAWDVRAHALTIASPRLAADPVGPVNAVSRGRATLDWSGGHVKVEGAELRLAGDARAAATVSLDLRLRPHATFDVRVDAPALDWHALAEVLPPQLAPGDDAPRVAGTFGVELRAAGPFRDAARWALDATVDLSRLGRERERGPLQDAFRHEAQLSAGRVRAIVVGPQNPSFVALATLPQHVVRAITIAEDASFWVHDGFDFHEMQDAIAAGARRGQLGRGASTISQQVAKNLWLGRERTLARKVREALLTIALEASVPKRRILEIYVNIAEWGPGIVGLGEAARHYFQQDARDLTPRQAAFLASIIPNPVRFHVYCSRGELSPTWNARVDELLTRLWATGVLTTDQLDAALVEPLVFTHG
jgi:hypothetical protein